MPIDKTVKAVLDSMSEEKYLVVLYSELITAHEIEEKYGFFTGSFEERIHNDELRDELLKIHNDKSYIDRVKAEMSEEEKEVLSYLIKKSKDDTEEQCFLPKHISDSSKNKMRESIDSLFSHL